MCWEGAEKLRSKKWKLNYLVHFSSAVTATNDDDTMVRVKRVLEFNIKNNHVCRRRNLMMDGAVVHCDAGEYWASFGCKITPSPFLFLT